MVLCFRVKFYPAEPMKLKEEITRYERGNMNHADIITWKCLSCYWNVMREISGLDVSTFLLLQLTKFCGFQNDFIEFMNFFLPKSTLLTVLLAQEIGQWDMSSPESTCHWFSSQMASIAESFNVYLLLIWSSCWTNNFVAGDLRCYGHIWFHSNVFIS